MKQYDQYLEKNENPLTVHEMLQCIRLFEPSDGNIIRQLELEFLSDFVAVDIGVATGLDVEEVLLVIECLRHFESIHRLAGDD